MMNDERANQIGRFQQTVGSSIQNLKSKIQNRTGARSANEALAEATNFLKARGAPDSQREAEILLAHVLATSHLSLYIRPEQPLSAEQESHYQELLGRRAKGEPVAYLTGQKEFFSLTFEVNRSVLIPRPETEQVVEAALERLWEVAADGRTPIFFDVGTGSGVIAIALLVERKESRAVASDISAAALDVARRNAQRHGVADRLTLIEGDLFAGFGGAADVVVSNPPYVGENERDVLPPEVRNCEPPEALFAGHNGLAVIQRLVDQAPHHLLLGGWLIFEIGNAQDDAVRELLEADGRWTKLEIRNDLAGIPRVVIAQLLQSSEGRENGSASC